MKMLDCIPNLIAETIGGLTDVREIRIRNNRPVKVNVGGRWYYVGMSKPILQVKEFNALIMNDNACDEIITKACNKSVYAHEKTLSGGYFTLDDGVRVGVCGSVSGKDKPIFQKFTSLCFRVPHIVSCVESAVLSELKSGSAVIIGAPASGKTTLLRDCAIKISQSDNVLVADERGELYYNDELIQSCDADVLKWTSKKYALDVGVRALSPDYIFFDEISEDDAEYVKKCVFCGVKVFCTAHGRDYNDFLDRFAELNNCFDYAIILSDNFKKTLIYCKRNQTCVDF